MQTTILAMANPATLVMFASANEGDTHAVAAWLDECGGLDARLAEFNC